MPANTAEGNLASIHVDTERTWRGGEGQALALALGLTRRGHPAVMVGRPGSAIVERARAAGVAAVETPMHGELDWFAARRIARIARDRGAQLIHAHTAHAHTLAAMAAWSAGIPCVVSRRVDFAPRGIFSRFKYGHGVTRFVAISAAVRGVLVEAGVRPERIAIVPSGIDPARLDGADRGAIEREFGLAPDTPVVGAVGHCAWHKGFETLIDAVPELRERHPDLRVFIVGGGELQHALRARAARTAGGAAITLTGFRADVPSFLARFDVVAAPSLMEGLNTSVLDALAMARPVVASNVGGLPEAVEHEVTGTLVEPARPDLLAGAVLAMLADRERAARLGAAGRARVLERFTVDSMVEGTLRVYRDLLQRS